MVQFHDALTLDAPKRTAAGFMVVRARSARAGVYDYLGREVDPEGTRFKADQVVKVYRPADEVFDKASIASFIAKPVTNDHPSVPVTADNWKQHSRGAVMGALRDREYLAFDLTIMDRDAIADVDAGKRELSNGYSCDLDFTSGTTDDGLTYDAVQRNIRGNHVAIVDRGRAGSECRISDGGNAFADCQANPQAIEDLKGTKRMTKLTIDGLIVDLSDVDAVNAALAKKDAAISDAIKAKDALATDVAKLTTDLAAANAKVTTLEKQVTDSAITPAKLRDAAKSYQLVVDKAKALGVAVTDDMDEAAIQKAAVTAKLGDAAKDWTADQVAVSFATLTVGAKDASATTIHAPVAYATDNASVRDIARASQYA